MIASFVVVQVTTAAITRVTQFSAQPQHIGATSGSRNQGNRASRNNQGPRTQIGRNSGAGRQVHGRINAMTQQEAEQDPRVITGTLLIYGILARVLIDLGATFSFVSLSLSRNINSQPTSLGFDMLAQMAHGDFFYAQWEYKDCPVIVDGD